MSRGDGDHTLPSAPAGTVALPTVAGAHARLLSDRAGEDDTRRELARLLQVGAAIEHSLMVQYLYSAYSLDAIVGDIGPAARWQAQLLTVAREEMGHLMTVQNALRLIGGAPNWKRDELPYSSPYYPFPMVFEPFTFVAIEKYVYAEMDPGIDNAPEPGRTPTKAEREWEQQRSQIDRDVKQHIGLGAHHVGELFAAILACLRDRTKSDDRWFEPETYPQQMSWDAWGKGYRPHPDDRDLDDLRQPPNVIVAQMGTRTELVDALRLIAGQGEAPHLGHLRTATPSHFDRFLRIYDEIETDRLREPVRNGTHHLPTNPTVDPAFEGRSNDLGVSDGFADQLSRQYIGHPGSRLVAELSNLRYRMLVTNLGHAFRVAAVDQMAVRRTEGYLMQRSFADMFNVKTLAGLSFRSPLTENIGDVRRSGPPFALPDDLGLSSDSEREVWELQLKLTRQSSALCDAIEAYDASHPHGLVGGVIRFVRTLRQLDAGDATRITAILQSLPEHGGAS